MSAIFWIELALALEIHDEQIAIYGGQNGLRDQGLLESALARPKNAYAYDNVDEIPVLAATLCLGLCHNHAFIDGNKRVAFFAAVAFLGMNGFWLDASELEAFSFVLSLAAGDIGDADAVAWFLNHAKPEA